jgi:hypothetical protein
MGQLRRYILLFSIFTLSSVSFLSFAQERCGTVQYSKLLHSNPLLQKIQFENWLAEQKLRRQSGRQARQQATAYQIPVVVHIIHNGEPVGIGPNIPEAQVLSQIRVLNEDFNRLNADTVNTPPLFKDNAGSMDIEFVLAKRNPEGQATDGIVRVDGGQSSWTINDNYELKALSYWPAEDYMNIWVCNLSAGYAGYAQFPESNLEGLENSSTNRLTDGIVIWHKAFGSVDDGAFNLDPVFNKGRTTTHETGHFLGLRHIWGDEASCSGTDYVSDTPNQAGSTDGCPTHPKTDACGEVIMFQNFLDYTNDECMNLFTEEQVNRMIIVLENSPRRKSLLTSPGLLEPDPVPNDLGIRTILTPDASVCSNVVTPVIEVRNYGSNAITAARIRVLLDGTVQETKDFALSLNPLESAEVSFSSLSIPSGTHEITFRILSTNGGADGATYNDEKMSGVIVPTFANPPFSENFNTFPAGWIIQNPDGQITWEIATAPKETAVNKALKLNYFDYEDKLGEIDVFLSPVMDLSSAPAATLSFDVAHARYQQSNDRLKVVILTNCQGINEGTVVYNKAGDTLKTASSTSSPFIPSGETQWRTELIDLSAFIGFSKVQIAFVGINDWGNNIYLDNIGFFTEETTDVALLGKVSPSVVTCEEVIAPKILIQNAGSVRLTSIDIDYSLNGAPLQTLAVNDLNLFFGAEMEISLPLLNLSDGPNILSINLENPNGLPDENPENDADEYVIVVNQDQDRIPLRQNFDNPSSIPWTIVNPRGGMNWEPIPTNFGTSLYFNAFNNSLPGDEAWLVSPVLDFSRTNQASMLFDLSYVASDSGREILTILASTDCGTTYREISYNFPNPEITNDSWLPQSEADWTTNISVNLNPLAGKQDVRIAFVIQNQQGNNLYLDNIEFFTSADPDPIEISEIYSVYGYDLSDPSQTELKITFNLRERQDVRYSVINAAGQLETDGILIDVLNQTFPLDLSDRLPAGVYFIRVHIGGRFYTTKVLVF